MKKFIILGLLALASSTAFAADSLGITIYVRAGASGNGSDWEEALNQLPATLIRGATYYLAPGTYPGYEFDDAESGTVAVTLRRATVKSHGKNQGWKDQYAEGKLVFTGPLIFKTRYYINELQSEE